MEAEGFAKKTWHRRTPRFGRRILRVLVLDVLVLAVLFAVGELVLRRFVPQVSRFIFTDTMTGGHPQVRNSRGLREREFPTVRPPGEIRVLCLGNSTTRGAGSASEHTYPKQLETMLNERESGDPYFVINAGGEGRLMADALEFLRSDGLAFDPSVVVLGFSPSMVAVIAREQASVVASKLTTERRNRPSPWRRFSRGARRAATRLHSKLHGSYLYVVCNAMARSQLYRWGVLRDRMDRDTGAIFAYAFDVPGVVLDEVEASYALFAESLGKMKTLLDEHDIPLIVMSIPSRFRLTDEPVDNMRGLEISKIRIEPLDRVVRYCEQLDIPMLDLRKPLRAGRRAMLDGSRSWDDLYTPLDYTHLNQEGLRMAAEELRRAMDEHGWLPQGDRIGD